MSGARGKIEVFEPSNVAGLDTRVWQARGSASDVDGVVFSLRGEIVKVGGLQRLLRWRYRESSDEQPALTLAAEVEDNPFVTGSVKKKDRRADTILTVGTFVWDGSTEIVVAHYRPPPIMITSPYSHLIVLYETVYKKTSLKISATLLVRLPLRR